MDDVCTLLRKDSRASIIYHLQNHYSLLAGFDASENGRRLLGARSGQQPSTWITWHAIHADLKRSKRHNLVVLRYVVMHDEL